jgi:uncharacterized protein YfaS (alpha-2-macroglobulin family)
MKNKITLFSILMSASFLLSSCTSPEEEVFPLPGEDETPFIKKELPEQQKAPTDEEGFLELEGLPESYSVSGLPTIKMSSLPNEENEIGEKTPISITFDQEMNKRSVQESLVITPDIPGKIDWTDETLTFFPEEPYEAGKKYTLTLTTDALNAKGENLPQEYLRKFSVTDELKILSIIPTDQEVSPNTDISIIFNQPISELSTIDELEKEDFGIMIDPPFPFRYRLAGTNTLQIQGQMPADEYQDGIELTEGEEIEHRLPRSSRFTVTIPESFPSLNGWLLGEEESFSVSTPQIELITNSVSSISPFSPFIMTFNQPVDIESVRQKTTITPLGQQQIVKSPQREEPIPDPTFFLREEEMERSKTLDPSDFVYEEDMPNKTENDSEEREYLFSYRQNEDGTINKTQVEIIPGSKFWEYNASYLIKIDDGIKGTEGNLYTPKGASISLSTLPFVRLETEHEKVGPEEEITMVFDQAPDSLDDIWNALEMEGTAYSLRYEQICEDPEKRGTAWEEDCQKIDDKKRVIMSFLKPLENNTSYTITISNGLTAVIQEYDEYGYSSPNKIINEEWIGKEWTLLRDQFLFFETPEKPKILGHFAEEGNYKTLCVYTNNRLDEKSVRENLVFDPPLPTNEIDVWNQPVREIQRRGEIVIENCQNPQFKGRNAVEIRTNLDFTTEYSVSLSDEATDIYGQSIPEEYAFDHTTGERTSDDILIQSISPYQQVIAPTEKDAIVVFSSQNVPKELQVDICQKDMIEILQQEQDLYNRYLDNPWIPSEENCDRFLTTTLPVPSRSWQDVYTEVNLKEILGDDFENGGYIVAAHHPKKTWTIYERGFAGGQKEKQAPLYANVIVQVTDLSVVAKTDNSKKVIWVSRLSNGSPIADAEISLLHKRFEKDRHQIKKAELGITDGQGIVQSEEGAPWEYIMAETEDDSIIAQKYWTIGQSANQNGKQQHAYIFTDRPIYRPGDSGSAKVTVFSDDDAFYSLLPSASLSTSIRDSRGNEILEKQELLTNDMGSAEINFEIPADAALGEAWIQICTKQNVHCFSFSFSVEEYKKPEFEISATPEKTDYLHGESAKIEASGEYYFGAPLSNGEVDYSLKRKTYRFDRYTQESGYVFEEGHSIIRPLAEYSSSLWSSYEQTEHLKNERRILSENGKSVFSEKITLPFSEKTTKSHPQEVLISFEPIRISKTYTAEFTAQDSNENPVYTSAAFTAHATEKLVGIKPEKWSSKQGEELPIDLVMVDTNGNTLSEESATLTVIRQEYISEEDEDQPTFRWIPPNRYLQESVVFERDFTSGEAGKVRFLFTPEEAGQYKIVAEMKDSKGELQRASTNVYIYGKDVVDAKRLTEKRIDLLTDKQEYNIGDTAQITVLSPLDPENSKYMLSMERGKLYRAGITEISDPPVLEVPITEEMLPNMTLTLTGQQYGDSPALAFGEVDLMINTAEKELEIAIGTEKDEYLPGEEVELNLKTKGKTELAIMVVDKANLALMDSKRQNILEFFYQKRDRAVQTIASLLRLNSEIDLSMQYEEELWEEDFADDKTNTFADFALDGIAGGGDAEDAMIAPSMPRNQMAKSQVSEKTAGKGSGAATKTRTEFKDTAFFEAIVTTDENGEAATSFTLPDNLTTWEILVIGMDEDFNVGEQTKDLVTKKPLLLRPQLPRFVRYGDELALRANVHNETGNTLEVITQIQAENLNTQGNTKQSVSIPAGDSADVLFSASAQESKIGEKATITITASAAAFTDTVEISIPVLSYSTPETVASSGITTALSYFEKIRLPDYVEKHIGHLKIHTSATLAHFLHSGLDSLVNYPYGCNEQIASRLLGLVIYHDITTMPNIEGKMEMPVIKDENDNIISYEKAVENALTELQKNQRFDGGWGYWLGSREASAPLTTHILHTLQTAKSKGEDVPEIMTNDARRFVVSYLERKEDLKSTNGEIKTSAQANARAYMLSVLSQERS